MSTTEGGAVADAPDAAPGPPGPPRPRAPAALVVLAVLAVGFTLWAAQGLLLPGMFVTASFALPALIDPARRDVADSPRLRALWERIERLPRPRWSLLALGSAIAWGALAVSVWSYVERSRARRARRCGCHSPGAREPARERLDPRALGRRDRPVRDAGPPGCRDDVGGAKALVNHRRRPRFVQPHRRCIGDDVEEMGAI